MTKRIRKYWVGPALAALIAFGACATDADSGEPEEAAPQNSAPAPAPTVAVTAVDYAFEDLPASIDAGSTLTLTNSSADEVHELVAFRLPEEETRSAQALVQLPAEELEALVSGMPAAVLTAAPSSDGFAVVGDGTLSEPGRYLFACFIPTGADPGAYMEAAQDPDLEGAPQVDGGPPHFTQGMFAEAVVR